MASTPRETTSQHAARRVGNSCWLALANRKKNGEVLVPGSGREHILDAHVLAIGALAGNRHRKLDGPAGYAYSWRIA